MNDQILLSNQSKIVNIIERYHLIIAPIVLITFLLVGWAVEWLITNYSFRPIVLIIFGIPVTLILLLRTRFLIFLTALILMLTFTHISVIYTTLAQVRWVPYFLFAFIVLWPIAIRKTLIRKLRFFDAIIVLFLLYAFFSSTYSVNPQLTIFRAITLVLLYIAVFWGIWGIAQKVGEVKIVKTLVLAAMIVIFASVLFAPFNPNYFQLSDGRFRGILGNPNAIASLASFVLPLAIWQTANYRRWFDVIFLVCLGGVLLLSASRAQMANGLICIGFLLYRKGRWGSILILGGLVVILLTGIFTLLSDASLNSPYIRIQSLFDAGGRLEGWSAAVSIARQHLLLGHGFGTEELLFGRYGFVFKKFAGSYSHNSYLGMTLQLGLLGALLFFVPLLLLLMQRLRSNAFLVDPSLTHALEAVLVIGLFSSIFESWPYSVGNTLTFFFWTCVMLLVRLHLASIFERRQRIKMNRAPT